MKKKTKEFVPLRLKVCTVLSGIVLAAVCSLELIDLPFKNELWFGLIIITLLLGCMLLMGWSFGLFGKEK